LAKAYLLLAASLLLLSGCSKVTKENYDKIETGMPYDEVVQLIGKPKECSEALGISSCEWQNGKARVDIKFISNQVTFFSAEHLN
jgi:hypothetical protein